MPAKTAAENVAGVVRWRRRVKALLVAGFGGQCGICGYSKSHRALTFHHLDPTTKLFSVAGNGIPRAWKRLIDEAKKCVMLCNNCHAEVHDGVTAIPGDIRRFADNGSRLPMRRRRVARKRSPENFKPKRERPRGKALKELVRASSRVAVAAKFGVSETAVRKWIKTDSLNGIY